MSVTIATIKAVTELEKHAFQAKEMKKKKKRTKMLSKKNMLPWQSYLLNSNDNVLQ